ncbi:MAG: hypothetical protein AB1540_02730 [Bdellovibrionota bacterium]
MNYKKLTAMAVMTFCTAVSVARAEPLCNDLAHCSQMLAVSQAKNDGMRDKARVLKENLSQIRESKATARTKVQDVYNSLVKNFDAIVLEIKNGQLRRDIEPVPNDYEYDSLLRRRDTLYIKVAYTRQILLWITQELKEIDASIAMLDQIIME